MNMRIKVRYFALYRELAGTEQEFVTVQEGSSLGRLLEGVRKAHPILDKQAGELLLAVNAEYSPADRVLTDGDEVAIFPSVSGG